MGGAGAGRSTGASFSRAAEVSTIVKPTGTGFFGLLRDLRARLLGATSMAFERRDGKNDGVFFLALFLFLGLLLRILDDRLLGADLDGRRLALFLRPGSALLRLGRLRPLLPLRLLLRRARLDDRLIVLLGVGGCAASSASSTGASGDCASAMRARSRCARAPSCGDESRLQAPLSAGGGSSSRSSRSSTTRMVAASPLPRASAMIGRLREALLLPPARDRARGPRVHALCDVARRRRGSSRLPSRTEEPRDGAHERDEARRSARLMRMRPTSANPTRNEPTVEKSERAISPKSSPTMPPAG